MRLSALIGVAALATAALTGSALATPSNCRNTQDFGRWLEAFKREAVAQGIKPRTIAEVSPYLVFDPSIIRRDRGQSVFQQSFLQFSDRMVALYRIQGGGALLKQHAALFARIEKQWGIPGPVLVAFWGLESDFGRSTGNFNTFTALATLAYDCRRPDFFRPQLMDAMRIVERGDLTLEEMTKGDWAGEVGAMQFTASDYYKHAVDYDGDGRRDLVRSTPDTLASAANFLSSFGWNRGEPWLQEVRVPANMPWEEADLAIQHPRSQWIAWGVRAAHGSLPSDTMPASLVLPMGRLGPAFLAYNNFKAFLGWNSALVYSTTVAYYATRLSGAPPVSRGNGQVTVLSIAQVSELQQLLTRHGYDVGTVDGKLGSATRQAIKQAQLKVGLPADSYPTLELIERLRGSTAAAR
ncbi:MAG TPA: lytic murein transglycosylase [Pseudolabrys sp.]|nr:lytic murein transglycosylase [Pseudolabrys sp.]